METLLTESASWERSSQPTIVRAQHAAERLPALDGVRGLAILLVLLLHFASVALPSATSPVIGVYKTWGWLGVDLFFVLSGFLITGILLDAKGSPRFFRTFYARRVVRILPAYYVLLLVMLLLLPALAPGLLGMMQPGIYGPDWTYWTHTSNLYFALHATSDGPLGHTWSLAIEEQFYLVWPALAFLLSRGGLLRLCVGLVLVAPLARAALLLAGCSPLSIYFFTLTRLDGLVIGAIVASLFRIESAWQRLSGIAPWLGAASMLLLGCCIALKKLWGAPGAVVLEATKFTWISLACAALVVLAITTPKTRLLGVALRSGVATFLGRYSYGLYLFHLPVIAVIGTRFHPLHRVFGDWLAFAVYLVLTLGLSQLSWHLMEKHFLKLKRRFG